jgi:hypothetical protein
MGRGRLPRVARGDAAVETDTRGDKDAIFGPDYWYDMRKMHGKTKGGRWYGFIGNVGFKYVGNVGSLRGISWVSIRLGIVPAQQFTESIFIRDRSPDPKSFINYGYLFKSTLF